MASLSPMSGILGKRLAAHLLRRTTYKLNQARIDYFATKTVAEAVDELMVLQPNTLEKPIDDLTGQPWIDVDPEPTQKSDEFFLRANTAAWWVNEALQDNSIGHKIEFILHSIWITHNEGGTSNHFYDYLRLLHLNPLGSYKKLAFQMTMDNLMLIYLDNTYNTKENPNENYARELLELFTMGIGNYNADDIATASRLLTGFAMDWNRNTIDPETGFPSGYYAWWAHDTGDKTFSAYFDNTTIIGRSDATGMPDELQDFIDMIFAQDVTANYIVKKFYRALVGNKITAEVENDIIAPLAADLRDPANDYQLGPIIEKLLKSEHFFDADDTNGNDEIVGGLIRSPLELALHTFSYFGLPIPDPLTASEVHYKEFYMDFVFYDMFTQGGMTLFQPDSPAGYPAYYQAPNFHRQWFNSGTIVPRYKMPQAILTGKRYQNTSLSIGSQLDIVTWVANNISNPYAANTVVEEMVEYLFAEPIDADRMAYFLNDAFLANTMTSEDWAMVWQEYETNGTIGDTEPSLRNLVTAIMYSPEYQLF